MNDKKEEKKNWVEFFCPSLAFNVSFAVEKSSFKEPKAKLFYYLEFVKSDFQDSDKFWWEAREILMNFNNVIIIFLNIGHGNWIPSSRFQINFRNSCPNWTHPVIRNIFCYAYSYNIEQKSNSFKRHFKVKFQFAKAGVNYFLVTQLLSHCIVHDTKWLGLKHIKIIPWFPII